MKPGTDPGRLRNAVAACAVAGLAGLLLPGYARGPSPALPSSPPAGGHRAAPEGTPAGGGAHPVPRAASGAEALRAAAPPNRGGAGPRPGPIRVGEVEIDPPTFHCLGLALPILGGETNYAAWVQVSYRKAGGTWMDALPLLRVRPETMADAETDDRIGFTVREQFAGSIFDLEPDTAYDVRLDVLDPEGGSTTRLVTARTRPLPKGNPLNPRPVPVSDMPQLRAALADAKPGDVITLAEGQYDGAIEIARSGTETNPLFVRGEGRGGAVLNASGAEHGITIRGSNVTVENVTVKSSTWGMRVLDVHDVVIRHLRITDVSMGIDAAGWVDANGAIAGHRNRNVTICDNVLEGKEAVWPNVDRRLWNFEGIVIVGSGHVVCHNTLSGFGDALGMDKGYRQGRPMQIHREWYTTPNRSIDFYGNDVLWGGDDGIELDLSQRNVRAFRNRISNTGMGISFQPIWGGPAYAFRNIIYNTAKSPFKLNNDPSGFYILHNTAVRPGTAWIQYSGSAANFRFHNNLTIGSRGARRNDPVIMDTKMTLGDINWNGWFPDGPFRFGGVTWRGFDDVRRRSPYERKGVLLRWPVFEKAIPIPADHTPLLRPLDDITLHRDSNAIDAGVVLPNINDHFGGRAPDLGAWERGERPLAYGVRPSGR